MTVQAGQKLASVLLALATTGPLSLAQTAPAGERVFGQLKPGQQVVQIDQADAAMDGGWSPVEQPVPESLARPVPESARATPPKDDFAVDGAGDIAPVGGLNILEELAQRAAQADAASARHAAQLAAERERTAQTNAAGSTAGPSDLVMDFPPQEQRPIGPVATDRQAESAVASDGPTAAPSTNLARDWFSGQSSTVQTLLALGLVILLIYALSWAYRRMTLNKGGVAGVNSGKAPSGLLEVLGRYPLGGKQSLVLLKFDRRVLLLCQGPSGKGGIEMKTLCELDEPEDVASVLMKVRDADGESLNKAFRSAMSKAELGASGSERMIEPKATPAARPSKAKRPAPTYSPQVQPKPDVVPGHRDPFNGFGGDFVRTTRNVSVNPEGDRSELWGTPTGSNGVAHDPVAALKQRLEAMRRGERVG